MTHIYLPSPRETKIFKCQKDWHRLVYAAFFLTQSHGAPSTKEQTAMTCDELVLCVVTNRILCVAIGTSTIFCVSTGNVCAYNVEPASRMLPHSCLGKCVQACSSKL